MEVVVAVVDPTARVFGFESNNRVGFRGEVESVSAEGVVGHAVQVVSDEGFIGQLQRGLVFALLGLV